MKDNLCPTDVSQVGIMNRSNPENPRQKRICCLILLCCVILSSAYTYSRLVKQEREISELRRDFEELKRVYYLPGMKSEPKLNIVKRSLSDEEHTEESLLIEKLKGTYKISKDYHQNLISDEKMKRLILGAPINSQSTESRRIKRHEPRSSIDRMGDEEVIRGTNRNGRHKPSSDKARRKTPQGKTKGNAAVHFTAFVDTEAHSRMAPNDTDRLGTFDSGVFFPKDNILRIWNIAEWSDKNLFRYDTNTGQLEVKKKGTYFVYSQVVFHDSSSRKSVGLYKNNDSVPILEAISFDLTKSSGDIVKRHAPFDGVTHDRSPRAATLYSQCNFGGLFYADKKDKVYLKLFEGDRGILIKEYLTYWGIIKMI